MRIRSGDGEFSYGDFSDFRNGGGFREVFEIEFESLLEIGDGFLFGGTETGHVVIKALGDVIGLFPVEGVVDVSHKVKMRRKPPDCKVVSRLGRPIQIAGAICRTGSHVLDWSLAADRLVNVMRAIKCLTTLGIGILVHSAGFAAESRIWTSRKGSTIEAELLSADATTATLVTKDAKQIPLKFEDLSLGDRQYLVEFGGADPKILVAGEVGEPEKQVRIDSATIKKLKDKTLQLGDESAAVFQLTESEHFLVASAGDVHADGVAETAERLWHGMAFQHMNFRRDWADKRMLVLIAENREAFKATGDWYAGVLMAMGRGDAAGQVKGSWDKMGSIGS